MAGLYPGEETAGRDPRCSVDIAGFAEETSLSRLVSSARVSGPSSLCSQKPGCALLGAAISLGVEGTQSTSSGLHRDERQTV